MTCGERQTLARLVTPPAELSFEVRCHPETSEYGILAERSGNTFGLEFDADGRLYSGHYGGDTRGWHDVQGGFDLMQGVEPGKFGSPRHPYAFGDLSGNVPANVSRIT